jgi:hypothetical protein
VVDGGIALLQEALCDPFHSFCLAFAQLQIEVAQALSPAEYSPVKGTRSLFRLETFSPQTRDLIGTIGNDPTRGPLRPLKADVDRRACEGRTRPKANIGATFC